MQAREAKVAEPRHWNDFSWVLLALHIAGCATVLWFFQPRIEGNIHEIEGPAAHHMACGRMCDKGIFIGETLLGCWPNWFGPRYSCPQNFEAGQPARGDLLRDANLAFARGNFGPIQGHPDAGPAGPFGDRLDGAKPLASALLRRLRALCAVRLQFFWF
ncbi:MAG: hypothetical protein H0X13_07585 [Ramlibacter sp.]|nr:hypothetical protein [Ramlibacter sp.]